MGKPNSAAREVSVTKTKGVWLKTTHLFCWFEIETSKYLEFVSILGFNTKQERESSGCPNLLIAYAVANQAHWV